ncbi:SDR family oxidoreductase [soil metagenome]
MTAPGRFAGEVAVVTGAAQGIGHAVASQLLAEGCKVAMLDVDKAALEQAEESLSTTEARFIQCDVSDEASVAEAFAAVVKELGPIDLLHNNAGILIVGDALAESSVEDFDRLMAINVRGSYLALREFVRRLRADDRPGNAVNTTSSGALRTAPAMTAYTMSKHAIVGLTRSAAIEYGPFGIRINAVAPGRVDTPMAAAVTMPGGALEKVAPRPISRMADAHEIARTVTWLLSDESSFTVGAIVAVDEGNAA